MDAPRLMIVSAAALIDSGGYVLVQRRPDGANMAGLWEFPGGKLEHDEDPETALLRELHEELGIVIDRADVVPCGFASEPLGDRHLLLLLFVCRKWAGTPQPLQAAELRWLPIADLRTLDMPPADLPLTRCLGTLL